MNDDRSPYVFRISSINHHKIETLLAPFELLPKFGQLYIYDTSNELSNRLNALGRSNRSDIRVDIVQGLQAMLGTVNPYVAILIRAYNMLRDHEKIFDVRIRIIHTREDG